MITLQGCTSSHTLPPLTVVYTTCTRQASSGSPTRVSATAYLNTQVSSPGLSPIQVPSAGSPAEVSTYGPERCVQGSVTPNGYSVHPATYLPHHSPPLRSALSTASSILQTPETTCNSWTEDKGDQEAERVHWFQAQCVVVIVSWITNTELSS